MVQKVSLLHQTVQRVVRFNATRLVMLFNCKFEYFFLVGICGIIKNSALFLVVLGI